MTATQETAPAKTDSRPATRTRPAAPAARQQRAPVAAPAIATLPAVAGGLETRAPGVYFGLDEADYHADPSLGSTDLKNLARGPSDYWHASKFNPTREDDDTPAKFLGRAFHKRVLEGRAAFEARYATEPAQSDFEGLLVSTDDLKAYAKERGEAVSGTKSELIARIRKHDTERPIWDEIIATFKTNVEAAGLTALKAAQRAEIEAAAAAVTANPHLANAFSGGVPEVSIFWRRDGVPMKCRFDYLKPAVFVDLKRLANPMGLPFDDAALRAIGNYRYDIQIGHYLDGWAEMLALAGQGLVFGDCPLPERWPDLMATPDEARAVLVFHQATGAPVTRGYEISAQSTALTRARRQIAEAKSLWLDHITRLGPSVPWHGAAPIRTLEDADLPPWMRDRTAPIVADASADAEGGDL